MHKKLTISSRSNLWQNNSATKGLSVASYNYKLQIYFSFLDSTKTQVSSSSLFPTSQPEKDSLFSAPKESLFGDLAPLSPQLMTDKLPAATQQLFTTTGPVVPSSPHTPLQSGRVLFQTPSNTLFSERP